MPDPTSSPTGLTKVWCTATDTRDLGITVIDGVEYPDVYVTRTEAEKEIADLIHDRLATFMDDPSQYANLDDALNSGWETAEAFVRADGMVIYDDEVKGLAPPHTRLALGIPVPPHETSPLTGETDLPVPARTRRLDEPLTLQQYVLARAYNGGEFAWILESTDWRGDLRTLGDTLFVFLMLEFSKREDCTDNATALQRVRTAIQQLQTVREALLTSADQTDAYTQGK
jgi:hypothetical protein